MRSSDCARALDRKQLDCLVGIGSADTDVIERNEVLVGNLSYAADELSKEGTARTISSSSTTSATCRSWRATSPAPRRSISRASPMSSLPTIPAAMSRERAYPFLFRHLDAIGYRGWVGCEYKPRTTTVDGLGWHAAQIFET